MHPRFLYAHLEGDDGAMHALTVEAMAIAALGAELEKEGRLGEFYALVDELKHSGEFQDAAMLASSRSARRRALRADPAQFNMLADAARQMLAHVS